MFGTIELKTDDERFIVGCLLDLKFDKPDKEWLYIIFNKILEDGKLVEVDMWDSSNFISHKFFPLLKKYKEKKIDFDEFCRDIMLCDSSIRPSKLLKESDLEDLYGLFEKAEAFKLL